MLLNNADKSFLGDLPSSFASMTFCALRKSVDQCGSNGLPLTPNSIKILGRAQFLKSIKHKNLCLYLDVIRGKYERTVVVSEYSGVPITQVQLSYDSIISIAREVLTTLEYLHSYGIIHRNLSPDNILMKNDTVKLFNYGLFYMTGNGSDVMFPIGCPKYLAPELLLGGPTLKCSSKVDIWALGVILVELLVGSKIYSSLSLRECLRKITGLCSGGDAFMKIAADVGVMELYQALPRDAVELVNKMLTIDPLRRPTATELLGLSIFKTDDDQHSDHKSHSFSNGSGLTSEQLYYFWQLSGGDVYQELKKEGLIRSKPPILTLPNLIMLEGTFYGQKKDESAMLDARLVRLNLNGIIDRLSQLSYYCHYPLVEYNSGILKNEDCCDSDSLPLVIRERDTEYQYRRVVLLSRLIQGYPYKKDMFLKEARHDIPPFMRSVIWSALLNIDFNYSFKYRQIDKESPMLTDRQIEVDIPRCHQYNELLSSVEGHKKFKRILKAWVISHPQYVYWQGLDSLCAPFLFLNFHDEARAFACLCKFIYKYLHDFFLKDNSAVIREYLAKFRHLIAFHDPQLANHLSDIAFTPELFAIPWYLTMFSHVFPIHKILNLWDSLLLGNASYPLYVGFAILQQLRDTLLSSGFNECILLFSDLPDIDIEKVVKDSITFYCSTPSSVTFRQHELPSTSLLQPLDSVLDMSGQPLSELQTELSPRICARELIEILLNSNLKAKLVLMDIREEDAYQKEHVAGSTNIPSSGVILFSQSQSVSGSPKKMKIPELPCLQSSRGKIIVVIGDDNKVSSEICNSLVKYNYSKVCFLHGGVQSMRNTSFITSSEKS